MNAWPTIEDDAAEKWRIAGWFARVVGLAVVGLLSFLALPAGHGSAVAQLVAFVLICVGVGLWAVAEFRPQSEFERPVLLSCALGLVVVAACVGASAGGGGDSLIAFAIIAMLAAADALPLRIVQTIGVLGLLAVEISGIAFNGGAGTLLGFPLLLAIGLLTGRNRAAFRAQAEQARTLLAQNELLLAEQRRADVLDERARIAREIHDVLAHSLGALGIQLQTVKALFTVQGDPERALEALAKAQRMASEGLTETRRAVHALRTDTLPLHEEIARAGAEHAERHGIKALCETSGAPVPLRPEATVALLRIAQESLVNAVKHAPGKDVEMRIDYRPDRVRLTVANELPGAGAAPASAGPGLQTLNAGYGLTGMRERLLLLSGSLDAGARTGRWVVVADLPIASNTAAESSASPASTTKVER